MPNKHFYVAMGAASGVAFVAFVRRQRKAWYERHRWFRRLYRWNRDWFLYFPLMYLPFITWALIPDILHGTALVDKAVTRGPMFDVFYLHSSFERWEDQYLVLDWMLNTIGSLALLAIGIGTFAFYVRLYQQRVQQVVGDAADTSPVREGR